jgi:hypothetical protein
MQEQFLKKFFFLLTEQTLLNDKSPPSFKNQEKHFISIVIGIKIYLIFVITMVLKQRD